MSKKIMIIAVHPDDETLMAGGTILLYKKRGYEVYVLNITNVLVSEGWSEIIVNKRENEINKVSKLYDLDGFYNLNFPTTKLDTIPMGFLVEEISKVINIVKPNELILPNRSDVHTDHRISFRAVFSCTKNFRYPFIDRILMGETLSETEFAPALTEEVFIPNIFIDISDDFERKISIMEVYESEIMKDYLPRSISSIEALARYRGSRIGVEYAEAFQLLFEKV